MLYLQIAMSTLTYNWMNQLKSLQGRMTVEFIDYCNINEIDLVKWYRWQLHIIWEQRKIHRKMQSICTE